MDLEYRIIFRAALENSRETHTIHIQVVARFALLEVPTPLA